MASIRFLIWTIWDNQFRCLKKLFSNWIYSFLKSRLNFEHFEKKMTFIRYVFPKLRTAKVVPKDKCLKMLVSEDLSISNMLNGLKHRLILHSSTFKIFGDEWMKFIRRMSLLVIHKILRLFVNTLTADDKYSLLKTDTIEQPIQMILSNKENAFSEFLTVFLKYRSNLKHFEKKVETHRLCISQITN